MVQEKQQIIPTDRPVQGRDLQTVASLLGLNTTDACWLFGVSMTKWMHIVNKLAYEPVRNPTHALLVRALANDNDASPLPPMPQAEEVFDAIQKNMASIDKKRVSLMFGREASGGYRWLTKGSKISPSLGRLFYVFMKQYMPAIQKPTAAVRMLDRWNELVEIEAKARGVDSIWTSGRWNTVKPHRQVAAKPPKPAKATKARKTKKKSE
jgi:hypothetical protein